MNWISLTQHAPLSNDRVDDFAGERRYLATGSVADDGSFVNETVSYASRPSRADLNVRSGDVCFARMQGTQKVLQISSTNADVILSTGFAVLRPDVNFLWPDFVRQWLQSPVFQSVKNRCCTGATQKAITNEKIETLTIPFFPLPVQKRIASILDATDALRAKRRKSIDRLDSLVEATFLEMFGDPVTNPKGWKPLTIGDVTSLVTYGLTVRPQYHSVGIPLISASQIKSGVIDRDAAPRISAIDFDALRPKCKAVVGDVLFSKTGAIGHVAPVASTEPIAIAQNVARLTPRSAVVHSQWFVCYLRSQSIQALAARMAKGNAQKDLQLGDLAAFIVPTPPIALQTRFASIVESIEQQRARLKAHLSELDTLFAALQSRAFNGELGA